MKERKWLADLPKVDLHCHLDGSLNLETVRNLTGKQEISWEDLQAAADCDSLKTYLEKFDLPLLGMQTAEGLREAAKSFLLDLKKENVMYVEVRFAPQLSVHEGFGCSQVIEAVLEGLREAEAICQISWRVICCAMRHHTMEQNLEVFRTATEYLDRGVCAVDLAGDEASYPASQFTDLFAEARALGIPFTIHAGECHSTENVRTSIEMGAKRIGHGIAMKEDPELMKLAAERDVGIEMCPCSNFQTKAVQEGEEYPLALFWEQGLLVTVNTDNRTVSHTSETRELKMALELMEASQKPVEDEKTFCRKLMENSIRTAFLPEEEKERLRHILEKFS